MSELELAKEAALAGGRIVARHFCSGVAVRSKATSNLVSDADIESEEAIVDVIRQQFPHHAVLGEEAHEADTQAEDLWIIDPLDGTNNFVHGIAYFAVSVAYYRQGQPQCGVVYDPVRDDCFETRRGGGAFCNGARVRVADHTQLDQALVAAGFPYDRGKKMEATLAATADLFRQRIHGIRCFAAASLDLTRVGQGALGAYFEYELSPWDFAAGRLFVEEAGGQVSTCRGEPLPLAKTGLLASNGLLHDAVLEVVRAHDPR